MPSPRPAAYSDIRALRRDPVHEADRPPEALYQVGEREIALFTLKRSGEPWPDDAIGKIGYACRLERGRFYGPGTPDTDEFDGKSHIYVARGRYFDEERSEMVTEWFSLRFVPAQESPYGCDELNFYDFQGRADLSMQELLLRAGHFNRPDDLSRGCFGSSALCGLPPESASGTVRRKHRCTELSWMLMTKHFLEQDQQERRCRLILFQMGRRLAQSCSAIPMLPFDRGCGLPAGSVALSCRPGKVRDLRYRHPGYFLDGTSAATFLSRLVSQGRLSSGYLRSLLPPGRSVKEFLEAPQVKDFLGLGALFAAEGEIPHSTLTGARLREFADVFVDPGPQLWMHPMGALRSVTSSYDSYRSRRLALDDADRRAG